MFNSPKMRKDMVVVMLLELLILLGLLVNDHIQAENRLRQQVHALATQVAALAQQQQTTAAQVAALTQQQQTIATELKAAQEQIQQLSERTTTIEEQTKALQSDVNILKQDVQTLKAEVQKLKKSCGAKFPNCKEKSKLPGKDKSPSKDKPGNGDQPSKKPECGNDKGTTSPPLHQVEMYYGAIKTVISVPAR